MARINADYSQSSTSLSDDANHDYNSKSSTPSAPSSSPTSSSYQGVGGLAGGWRMGGCLTEHLEYFKECSLRSGLFNPEMDHCLFQEQRPSPLPPGYGEELFCCCTLCKRVLMGESTPAETQKWREARENWRNTKLAAWKAFRKEREEAAVTQVELEGCRARSVVAAALNLTQEERDDWERKGEAKWRKQAKEEAYTRDYILRDGADAEEG
ncbi:hypothetical protein EST38_g8887 [Candolleomyces aberdarensis]|uniref:Uncharacterized protein n=1 Tax=Candolleomyces aberdarensis TaxID=2316362 RepID=A0A4Q2DC60_9AGAR|nr:hypothetical protein EST38_g8887 [Candolleomyces aberdarensis]